MRGIPSKDNIVHADIPDYIKAAALEVAKKVQAVRTSESIVFIAASDAHQLDTSADIVAGNKHAGMAMKALTYILPGIDFASALMAQMGQEGKSVFLLGAKPGVADAAAEKMRERFPGLVIAGTNDGYFQDDDPVVEKINAAQPDLLLVCLGAPKQELWMQRNAPRLRVGLMAGLGGSLDVFAGNVKRAPKFFQKLGLEWFYRLLKEPKRIGRMMKLPKFLFAAIGCKLRGKKRHGEG